MLRLLLLLCDCLARLSLGLFDGTDESLESDAYIGFSTQKRLSSFLNIQENWNRSYH